MVGLEADNGRWNIQLFVKNLLDDFYVDQRNTRAGNSTITYHYLNRDAWRYIGLQVEYRFGTHYQ